MPINRPFFNNTVVKYSPRQKHLGIYLDEKNALYQKDSNVYIKEKINKTNRRRLVKGISIIRKVQSNLPRNFLLAIYESFIRPHLYYGHMAYAY